MRFTPKTKQLIYIAVGGLVTLFVTTWMALSNMQIVGSERDLLLSMYGLTEVLRWPLLLITQLGSAWIVLGLTLGLLIRHRYRLGLRLISAGGIAYLITEVLKLLVMRPRPYLLFSDISQRTLSVSGYGFPSGHTALAFAASLTLWHVAPSKLRVLLVIWPLAVGFSRVYLGVHAPLDVVGGAAVGVFVAAMIQMFRRFPPFNMVK